MRNRSLVAVVALGALVALPVLALPASAATKPAVTKVGPTHGSTAGGSVVTVTGTGFSHVTAVLFDSTKGTKVTVLSSKSLTVTSPKHVAGTAAVRVVTTAGTSPKSKADHFLYAVPPTVSGITPVQGPLAGGTKVTVTGKNFTGVTGVTVGKTAVTWQTVSGKLVITTPAHIAGTPDVRVTNAGGTTPIVTVDKFTYLPLPTVSAVTPNAGPLAGKAVQIFGAFNNPHQVLLDGVEVPFSPITLNPNLLNVTLPAHSAGTLGLQVVDDGGTSTVVANSKFTYAPKPVVTGLNKTSGPARSGVTAYGDFHNVMDVLVNGKKTDMMWTYDVQGSRPPTWQAIMPEGVTGTVDLQVVDAGGTSDVVEADKFTFVDAP
jgi:hypothetical protein